MPTDGFSPSHLAAFFSLDELAEMIVEAATMLKKHHDSDKVRRALLALFYEYAEHLNDAERHELASCIEERMPDSFKNPLTYLFN